MNTELVSKMREIHALVIGSEAKDIIGRGADALDLTTMRWEMCTALAKRLEKERDTALARLAEIEAREPLFWYRPVSDGEMYEGPVHSKSIGGKMMRDEKPGEWKPLYTGASPAQPFQTEDPRCSDGGPACGDCLQRGDCLKSPVAQPSQAHPLPTMEDALAAGDGLLHALIDKLQARVAELEAQPSQARELSAADLANDTFLTKLAHDAARYQSLRRGQKWSVIDGIGDTLRGDDLDAAIDAAINTKGAAS